ncbi:uncharacterized protein C8Q71DRAFT_339837 [Rhodofomes roseus]|uniref:Non-specific serine/threonine protein kinase n=1 Tax=Rhodofomes roseus TaxID=34475 RepID=A0ABQ8KUB6_9APHY|nr:uncharacterized protein C8Q71DRAFT_339837 [Rhodofomes roseus]KAH9841603.1 hypothetical protein C8Q71DRAFT_339837 [Rhodofomes roseus]
MRSLSRASSRSSDHSAKDHVDAISNYVVHEEVARGTMSVIYRATCKRGRLRGRQVALKMTPISKLDSISGVSYKNSSTLHQSLHHPCIVTLFSEFSTMSDSYQVLELCPRGSLQDFLRARRPPVLSEDELRGILKNLVDALAYLRRQRILHGDIKPGNILLTDDLRAKLSGFDHAIQLPTMTSTVSTFRKPNAYSAPEVVSGTAYGFSIDVWALGCLVLTCSTSNSSPESFFTDNIPHTLSLEVRDLASQMLHKNPDRRIDLHCILSHTFFKPSQTFQPPTTVSMRPRSSNDSDKENESTPRPTKQAKYPTLLSKGAPPPRGALFARPPDLAVGRRLLAETRNSDLRRVLSDEISRTTVPSALARRFVSAPQSSSAGNRALRFASSHLGKLGASSMPATPALTDDIASVSSGENGSYNEDVHETMAGTGIVHPLLARSKGRIDSQSTQERTAVGSGAPSLRQQTRASSAAKETDKVPSHAVPNPLHQRRTTSAPSVALPTLVSAPEAISTAYLSPQTHKVAHGQLVVLPSRSLLVDFREGERRRGKKGNEVLLISPDGSTIQVYSAPHLSTPCCLAEPLATYVLSGLPEAYRKAYDDANRLVNQLKQRVPKLVLYQPDYKCTLMANEPLGDIELIGKGHSPENLKAHGLLTSNEPHMRITLRRRRQSVEIARFIPSAQTQTKAGTGEWIRKVLPVTTDYLCVSQETLAALEVGERDGLERLAVFLQLCEALEMQERDFLGYAASGCAPGQLGQHKNDALQQGFETQKKDGLAGLDRLRAHSRAPSPDGYVSDDGEGGTLATMATSASTKALPSFELAPRPYKFSASLHSRSRATSITPGSYIGDRSGSAPLVDQPESLPASCAKPGSDSQHRFSSLSSSSGADALETRFLPSVGWCMRSVSSGSKCYKIMFQDGATLEVDASKKDDEFWYAKTSEEHPMHLLRAQAMKLIPQRVEAYKTFVDMFCDH